jgi:hypothetical protein
MMGTRWAVPFPVASLLILEWKHLFSFSFRVNVCGTTPQLVQMPSWVHLREKICLDFDL